MLNLTNVALRRGKNLLMENVTLSLLAKQRLAIVGMNGSGKSTLLAAIAGELDTDAGEIDIPKGRMIGVVEQETPALDDLALEYVMAGDEPVTTLVQRIKQLEAEEEWDKLADCYAQMQNLGGYELEARAGELLHGLGFSAEDQLNSVADFSGGWRMRLNLARALIRHPDILLLDEPTNHLDLEAILWLESYLKHFPGLILFVSHDTDFMDSIATNVLFLNECKGRLYTGNYSTFIHIRNLELEQQAISFEKQQKVISRVNKFASRFRFKASKAKQVQSRLSALDKMEKVIKAQPSVQYNFEFTAPDRVPGTLCSMRKLALGYDDKPLLKRLSLAIYSHSRIALVGHNGAGKSSFLKLLNRELSPLEGDLEYHNDTRIGYFDQHQVDKLDLNASPIEHLYEVSERLGELDARKYLGGFGFNNERVFEPVGRFSGGEKSRLAFALLIYQRPNLLILDEPTNHLDMELKNALIVSLQSFDGGLVIISHDRTFVRSVVNELWLVRDGKVTPLEADTDEYASVCRDR